MTLPGGRGAASRAIWLSRQLQPPGVARMQSVRSAAVTQDRWCAWLHIDAGVMVGPAADVSHDLWQRQK